MYSRNAAYALDIMSYLTRNAGSTPVKQAQVASETGIPRHAVVKVVQAMHKLNLIETSRGSRGGITLARRPEELTLCQIVCAVDGPPEDCQVSKGIGVCQPKEKCIMQENWHRLLEQIQILEGCRDLKSFAEQDVNVSMLVPGNG
jgi:Rrf2 family protein